MRAHTLTHAQIISLPAVSLVLFCCDFNYTKTLLKNHSYHKKSLAEFFKNPIKCGFPYRVEISEKRNITYFNYFAMWNNDIKSTVNDINTYRYCLSSIFTWALCSLLFTSDVNAALARPGARYKAHVYTGRAAGMNRFNPVERQHPGFTLPCQLGGVCLCARARAPVYVYVCEAN